MTVYVDDFECPYGRMKMCHMIADTDDELHEMAENIGIKRKWHQDIDKHRYSHYDICLSKRDLAIKNGAILITYRQCGAMTKRRSVEGSLGEPVDVLEWMESFLKINKDLLRNQYEV